MKPDTLFGKPLDCANCNGACCKHIAGEPTMTDYDRGDGVCIHLNKDNSCDIYDSRPNICRSEKVYEQFKHQMTKDQYYNATINACKLLKRINDEKEDKV